MRYLLDTNIISNIAKPTPSESLLAWMADQTDDDLFIASLTVALRLAAAAARKPTPLDHLQRHSHRLDSGRARPLPLGGAADGGR